MATEQFQAWAASEPHGKLSEYTYTPRPLGDNDVEIEITHCGICASDVHQINSGWGPSIYPIVPGHEIVGHVKKVGSAVKRVSVGQRVGVGAQCFSCGSCGDCGDQAEPYCTKVVWTYNAKYADGNVSYGGYARHVRLDERFVFGIPEGLASENTAPLFCAGVTLYGPLKRFGAGPGKKVGIVGIGGLGHLGLKFARAMGAEVYAISHSPSKEAEAKSLGAHHFISSKNPENFVPYERTLDLIVSTVNSDVDYGLYMSLLKRDARYVVLGLPEQQLKIPPFALVGKRVSVTGSNVGSPSEIEEMLAFAQKHNIGADVEVFPITQVNEALEKLEAGLPRYRYVLKIKDN